MPELDPKIAIEILSFIGSFAYVHGKFSEKHEIIRSELDQSKESIKEIKDKISSLHTLYVTQEQFKQVIEQIKSDSIRFEGHLTELRKDIKELLTRP